MKYRKGKQVASMSDFDEGNNKMYVIELGKPVTKHRSFLESQQYRTLRKWIEQNRIYEAVEV